MKIRKPREMGLPEHITEWRSGQEAFIEAGLTDRARTTAICAPTGFGKTDAEIAIAVESGLPTCIVTTNKGLQDQAMKKYGSMGMVDIRGRVNYTCDMKQGYTCQDGYVANCPYKNTPGCPSSHAEMKASLSKLVITNYDKWIAARKFSTGMTHFQQVIFDEAHNVPNALAKAMQTIISAHEINDILHVDFPDGLNRETVDGWKQWAVDTREIAEAEMKMTDIQIKATSQPKLSWIRHFHHMRELIKRLGLIATARSKDWIVEEVEGGFQFDPISPGRYIEPILLFHIPKVILASASLIKKTLYMSGISSRLSIFHEFASTFNPDRGPVYYIPTMDGGYGNRHDMAAMWNRFDQIASRRKDRNGIAHTVSYSRQANLVAHSSFSHNMIVHQQKEPVEGYLDMFRRTYPGAILASPSIGTGYDFPMSECEWQFIANIPFIPGQSKIIKARQHLDREYKPYYAMLNFTQMSGRGNRSEEDQCETFIGDTRCEWFFRQNAHLAPKDFFRKGGFYRQISILPPPPPRLGA